MDPLGPAHLSGRSRYDTHLPPSQFVDPNYYPHATLQHHYDASFPPPAPPYQPQYRQPHWYDRNDHHPDDARLRVPYLRPPEPPRVPDLVLFPNDRYPSAGHRGSARGKGLVEEPIERRNFDVENMFGIIDDFNRLRWEEEERRRVLTGYRGNNSYQEDGLEIRSRWAQDANFGEHAACSTPRHLTYLGGENKYDGVPMATAYAPSSRVPRNFFVPVRGREVGYDLGQGMQLPPVLRSEIHSNSDSPVMERQFLPPMSLMPPSGHSYPDGNLEVPEKGAKAVHDASGHGSDYIIHNKGKRKLSGVDGIARSPMKPHPKRSSALSRLQFGNSVWNRLEEKPSFLTSPLPFSPSSFASDNPEMSALDMSVRSNSAVANGPSNFVLANGTGPDVLKPKKKKKRLIENREKVVIPIVSEALVSGSTKRLISNTSQQILNNSSEASGQVVTSSGKPVRPTGIKSADKNTERWIPKSVIVKEDGAGKSDIERNSGITNLTRLEPHAELAKSLTKETSKEQTAVNCKDNNAECCAQLRMEDCQNHISKVPEFMSDNDTGSSPFSQAESKALIKNDVAMHLSSDLAYDQNHVTNLSEFRSESDLCSQPFSQAKPGVLLKDGAAGRLSSDLASADNIIIQCYDKNEKSRRDEEEHLGNPDKKEKYVRDNNEESGCPDNGPVPSSNYLPSSAMLSDVQFSNLSFSTSKFDAKTTICKQTNEVIKLGVVMMAKERISIDEGQIDTIDCSLHVSPWSVSGHLSLKKDSVSDQHRQDITLIEKDGNLNTHVQAELPQAGCFGTSNKSAISPILSSPSVPRTDSSLLISEVQKVTDPEIYFPKKAESSLCTDNGDISNQEDGHNICDSLFSCGVLSSEAQGPKSDKNALPCQDKFEQIRNLGLQESKEQETAGSKLTSESLNQKASLSSSVPKLLPSSTNSISLLKETVRSSSNTRNRTWHRKDAASTSMKFTRGGPLSKLSPKKLGKFQSSYVRKGNALIRNPAIEMSHRKPLHSLDASNNLRKQLNSGSLKLERKVDAGDNRNPTFERPKTPPLPLGTNTVHVNQLGTATNSGDDQNIVVHKLSEQSNSQRITYVKHKSNQLIAAPGPKSGTQSDQYMERSHLVSSFMPSDLYYRKNKNQLVRNTHSSDNLQDGVTVSNTNLDDQRASMVSSSKLSSSGLLRTRLGKVLLKVRKHACSSHVWTLNPEESHKRGYKLIECRKVLPHFVPWKRVLTWANTSLSSKQNPLSLICQKPQSTRKRTTIYTLSNNGFSMRKTEATGTSMHSLKWSRSVEKQSKIANGEATLAVDNAQKKKREKRKSLSLYGRRQNCVLRERIFRVGSQRYQMDPSRRTLVRLQDEESSCSADKVTDDIESPLVPRRLSIGNDQYIRVGNGNKLIRDPKKLVRMLASEKVRWSLHTARSRMAKKKHYCQFFTRFGQCNRKDGSCPFIHDSAKIAICTKFLRGSCSNTNCRLTHKVIPERMPDCSYFLQGLCTKTTCPYRHVKVNPSASVCEAFLKGYCADGDECRKKHSYVCPIFKATGKCSQGSECKLHHPKGENKPKKGKQSVSQGNSWGRYFGSNFSEVGETLAVASGKNGKANVDSFCSDGRFADFVSLNLGNGESIKASEVLMGVQETNHSNETCEMQLDDLDALIKPIRIMGKACSTLQPINTLI